VWHATGLRPQRRGHRATGHPLYRGGVRIVLVSGHYPPDFVSGGSLQPQRLAHGLRARGHDVTVYAGRIGGSREPLEAWDELDGTGMPVRWIVTAPWDDWSDRRNWDAPAVRRDFEQFIARVAPDVVHFHDLQMLGGSLVSSAHAAGAAVVVTMHDYWWICPRLFLVDRHLHPCSLVVDAGTCACESGRPRLLSRKEALARHLADVDLVLTPSAIMARVLAANGVAPDRLDVDENGLPGEDLPTGAPVARPATGGPVRFTYAGGRHQLKGSAVVLRAAAELAGLDGWQLTTYGIDEDLGDALGLDLDALPVIGKPPFDASERTEVFDATDVLVVPSIARESYSIITREALGRGVPVICTDTLGPEEVVVDGVNGLVVRADDHEMLAAAMRAVTVDHDLLARLRRGAAEPVRVRSLDEQVAGLERRYADLLARRSRAPAPLAPRRRDIRRVVFAAGIEGAPLRYRVRLPAEALALLGVESRAFDFRHPALADAVDEADVLYVYRVPASPEMLAIIDRAKQRGIPVLFDVDDLIFDPQIARQIPALNALPRDVVEEYLNGVERYRTTLEASDGYVGSTRVLVEHARALTGLPAAKFDNGVGLLLARASDRACRVPRTGKGVRLGYFSGTITHDLDWAAIEPAVIEVMDRHPGVELVLGGLITPGPDLDRFAARIQRAPLVPWLKLPALLRSVDVNLAPLQLGPVFNEAKSAIKWLEAGLVATPTIASATEPFRDAIDHAVSGMLATDHDSWVEAIERLVDDDRLRSSMGERARRAALLRWSPHLQGRRFLEILEAARSWPAEAARRPSSGWQPVLRSEPFEPRVLEPYTASRFAGLQHSLDRQRARLDWARRRARASVERDGLVATAARTPAVIARESRQALRSTIHRARNSRARELVTYTRRLLAAHGPIATVRRAIRFTARRLAALAAQVPGVAAARAVQERLTRSLRRRGVRGTIELAAPVVRHHVVHRANLLRAHANAWLVRLGLRR